MREKVRDRGRLEHILEAIESIEEFHAQYTFEDIKKNKLIFYGFTKLVEVIVSVRILGHYEFGTLKNS